MSDMIIRVIKDKSNPFVMIRRETLQDSKLSLKARGLLSFLLSKPDDWEVVATQLASDLREHRETVGKLLRELETKGYCRKRELPRTKKGHFSGYDYDILEAPGLQSNRVEKTDTDTNRVEKIDTTYIEEEKTEDLEDNLSYPSSVVTSTTNSEVLPTSRSRPRDTIQPRGDTAGLRAPSPKYLKLALLLSQTVERKDREYFLSKNRGVWEVAQAEQFRQLIEEDGRQYDRVALITAWSQRSPWWSSRVSTAEQIRRSYHSLSMQYAELEREHGAAEPSPFETTAEQRVVKGRLTEEQQQEWVGSLAASKSVARSV